MTRKGSTVSTRTVRRALAALVVAVLAAGAAGCSSLPASGNVTNAALRDLASRGARIVDVRTAGEFAAGHIDGAENVPVDAIAEGSAGWDKSAPVVVYCQTGARSLNAQGYLEGQGFTHVYNLTAGVGAWDAALVSGSAPAAVGGIPATGRPTLYDFSSST